MPKHTTENQKIVATMQFHDSSHHWQQQPQPQQRAHVVEKRFGQNGPATGGETSVHKCSE
jgi:hypothetical protein